MEPQSATVESRLVSHCGLRPPPGPARGRPAPGRGHCWRPAGDQMTRHRDESRSKGARRLGEVMAGHCTGTDL